MDNSLLESFVERKAKAYAEPSRKGTVKGSPIGFSRKKFLATLYMLTADKQITKAMELGISYGLLRKWNTEEPFREMVTKNCKEFADVFVEHLLARHDERGDTPGQSPEDDPAEARTRSPLRDSGDYSPQLLAEILKSVVDFAETAEKEAALPAALTALSAFLKFVVPSVGGKTLQQMSMKAGIDLVTLSAGLKRGVIERLRVMLRKPVLTDLERREADYLLNGLETII